MLSNQSTVTIHSQLKEETLYSDFKARASANPELIRNIVANMESLKLFQQLMPNHELSRALKLMLKDLRKGRMRKNAKIAAIFSFGAVPLILAIGIFGPSIFGVVLSAGEQNALSAIWDNDIFNGTSCSNLTSQGIKPCRQLAESLLSECKALMSEFCSIDTPMLLSVFGIAMSSIVGLIAIMGLVVCSLIIINRPKDENEPNLKDILRVKNLETVLHIAARYQIHIRENSLGKQAIRLLGEKLIGDHREYFKNAIELKRDLHLLFFAYKYNLSVLPFELILYIGEILYKSYDLPEPEAKIEELSGEKESTKEEEKGKGKGKGKEKEKEEEEKPLIEEETSSEKKNSPTLFKSTFEKFLLGRPEVSQDARKRARQGKLEKAPVEVVEVERSRALQF